MKLADRIGKFADSSRFTSGDRLGFKIPVGPTAELPGRYDPTDYLEKLEVHQAKRALILGPGNGGLIGALLNMGCQEIVAVEPRVLYRDSLAGVVNFLKEAHPKAEIRTLAFWINEHHLETLGKFDLILWPDGLDDCQTPLVTLRAIFKLIKGRPKGRAFIEVWHGTQDHIPEGQVNSTKPSKKGWDRAVKQLLGDDAEYVKMPAQRTQTHAIYAFNYQRDVKGKTPPPPPAEISGSDPQHMAPLDPPKRDPRKEHKLPDGADRPENIQVDPVKVKAEKQAQREKAAKAQAEAEAAAREAEAAKAEAKKAKPEAEKAPEPPKLPESKELPEAPQE